MLVLLGWIACFLLLGAATREWRHSAGFTLFAAAASHGAGYIWNYESAAVWNFVAMAAVMFLSAALSALCRVKD